MPSIEVGAEVRMKRALNCWPWVWSLTHSPDAVIHSPAEIVAALQRGGIVEALKLVLAAKGVGSSGEKKSIAAQVSSSSKSLRAAPLPSKATNLSPGEVPRSSNDIWLLLLAAAALCLAYYFFAS